MSELELFSDMPITAAFEQIKANWQAVGGNVKQNQFLYPYRRLITEKLVAQLPPDMITAIMHHDWQVINGFLVDQNFPEVQLDPWELDESTVGIAAIFRMLSAFTVGQGVPNFKIPGKKHNFRRFPIGPNVQVRGSKHQVVSLTMLNGFVLNLKSEPKSRSQFDLVDDCWNLQELRLPLTNKYEGVILPQWIIPTTMIDVSWLIGMWAPGLRVVQAKMAARCGFGNGFKFESAFAASVEKGIVESHSPGPNDLVLSGPVTFWVTLGQADEYDYPIAVGHVPEKMFSSSPVDVFD